MDGKKKIELKIEELEERIAPVILGGGHSRVDFTNGDPNTAQLTTPAPGGQGPIVGLFGLRNAHSMGGLSH